jgi:hypothetical protein
VSVDQLSVDQLSVDQLRWSQKYILKIFIPFNFSNSFHKIKVHLNNAQ